MKFFTFATAAILSTVPAITASPLSQENNEDCNGLGLMDPKNVAEGVSRARQCKGHPLNSDNTAGVLSGEISEPLDVQFGCKSGYCWSRCGSYKVNQVCWMAREFGYGNWLSCVKDSDCGAGIPHNAACGSVGTQSCTGCGCTA